MATPIRTPTCGIVLRRPKTAALLFDLLYAPSEEGMPPNIITFPLKRAGSRSRFTMTQDPNTPGSGKLYTEMSFEKVQQDFEQHLPHLLAHLVRFGLHPIPIYDNEIDLVHDSQEASNAVLLASLTNLGLVDEEALEWKQALPSPVQV